jgi:hypothetical protein
MSSLIDELKEQDRQNAEHNEDKQRAEQIRLRNIEVCKVRLPIFLKEMVGHLDVQCSELRKAFPNDRTRHLNVERRGNEGLFRLNSEGPLPRRSIIIMGQISALVLYYVEITTDELNGLEQSSAHKGIGVSCNNEESLVLTFQTRRYDSPSVLSDALIRYVMDGR